MVTILQYLDEILKEQNIPDNYKREMDKDRERIERLINSIPNLPNPTFYYGGSRGKKTMIKESYDLDLVLYYPETTESSVEDIFMYVSRFLGSSNYDIYPKNVAIRVIKRADYHIDIVPGKRITGSEEYAFLWKSKTRERLKTSVIKHIAAIIEFGKRDVIKLIKLWKVRNKINFPSFILEQIIIRALKDKSDLSLDKAIIYVLNFISTKIESIRLEDPANTNNILTDKDVISSYDKDIFANAAKNSLEKCDLTTLKGWKYFFNPSQPFNQYQLSGVKGKIKPDAPDTRWGLN